MALLLNILSKTKKVKSLDINLFPKLSSSVADFFDLIIFSFFEYIMSLVLITYSLLICIIVFPFDIISSIFL